MNLKTQYLGLNLKNPLVTGASPISADLDQVRAAEDAGIAAVTMYSLFEEQISNDLLGSESSAHAYLNSFTEAVSSQPETGLLDQGVDDYLDHIQKVKAAVDIPIFASFNGDREGDWIKYTALAQGAGADVLELNLYCLATHFDESSADIEARYIRIVDAILEQISIPLTVKLSPSFTALPHFASRLAEAGVEGVILFNRFYQPDINVDALELRPILKLSYSEELLLRLRWLALLSGRINCQFAASGGVHTGVDVVKALMAGADTVQLVSTLLINGVERVSEILNEVTEWLEVKGLDSIEQIRGRLSHDISADAQALDRANYMRILKQWRP